jgi:hypothetical protein
LLILPAIGQDLLLPVSADGNRNRITSWKHDRSDRLAEPVGAANLASIQLLALVDSGHQNGIRWIRFCALLGTGTR